MSSPRRYSYTDDPSHAPRGHKSKSPITFENPWSTPNLIDDPYYPRYFRAVTSIFPRTKQVAQLTKLRFGVVISPALPAGTSPTDYSSGGIVRCVHCGAYLSPWSKFDPKGKDWVCCLCNKTNEIPNRALLQDRPETKFQVMDIIAPRPTRSLFKSGPSFTFIFDISSSALATGFPKAAALSVLSLLDQMSEDSYVCLMTISKSVDVYDLVRNTRMTVTDLDDFTVPPNTNQLGPSRDHLVAYLSDIAQMAASKDSPGHCLGSALEVCLQLMRYTGGIVLCFVHGHPTSGNRSIPRRPRKTSRVTPPF
jgi:protein transport protein SEC24